MNESVQGATFSNPNEKAVSFQQLKAAALLLDQRIREVNGTR